MSSMTTIKSSSKERKNKHIEILMKKLQEKVKESIIKESIKKSTQRISRQLK
jgi:hypothetical protein